MKFISANIELRGSFKELITQHKYCCICVAWASQESEMIELLDKYNSKIKKMIVGLDFCQTDYKFIEHNISRRAVRYYTAKHDGVFHPKVYLFYDDMNHWKAIVGSANLTYNGFSVNQEACVIIGDEDKDSENTYYAMHNYIDGLWSRSSKLTADDIANYKISHYKQIKASQKANTDFKPWKLDQAAIDDMTWDEYIKKLYFENHNNPGAVENRLELLKRARTLFASVSSFNSLQYPDRACLAGYKGRFDNNPDGIDCFFFGSTTRATTFTHDIKCKGRMSKAIEVIPLKAKITLSMYEDYCSYFDGNPIGSATRLLAIKRPDVFVCINNKNKELLCNDFGISVSKLNLKNYWDLIICRIQDSKWFNDNRSLKGDEKVIKEFQVAMLDSLYYRK